MAAYGTNVGTFNLASRPLRGISMGISIWQLVIILAIVLVLFGAKRLRGLGSDLGGALKAIEADKISIGVVERREELLLIPRMGPGAEVISEVFKGEGIRCVNL